MVSFLSNEFSAERVKCVLRETNPFRDLNEKLNSVWEDIDNKNEERKVMNKGKLYLKDRFKPEISVKKSAHREVPYSRSDQENVLLEPVQKVEELMPEMTQEVLSEVTSGEEWYGDLFAGFSEDKISILCNMIKQEMPVNVIHKVTDVSLDLLKEAVEQWESSASAVPKSGEYSNWIQILLNITKEIGFENIKNMESQECYSRVKDYVDRNLKSSKHFQRPQTKFTDNRIHAMSLFIREVQQMYGGRDMAEKN